MPANRVTGTLESTRGCRYRCRIFGYKKTRTGRNRCGHDFARDYFVSKPRAAVQLERAISPRATRLSSARLCGAVPAGARKPSAVFSAFSAVNLPDDSRTLTDADFCAAGDRITDGSTVTVTGFETDILNPSIGARTTHAVQCQTSIAGAETDCKPVTKLFFKNP